MTTRMTRKGALGFVQLVLLALLIVLRATPVHADNVDELIKQLENDSDKVRLSAALNLTKLGEAKAILPLAKVLGNDSDKNVRGAAAVGLGKLVDSNTKPAVKKLAINALKKAAANDESSFVKTQAGKALGALGQEGDGGSGNGGGGSGGGGAIYVNIGPMSSKTGNAAEDPKLRALMVKVATSTMGKTAGNMATTFPGGGVPTGKQLAAKGYQGFYVDGTLNEVKVTTSGSTATVSCKISMLLASFPDKSVFGFLNGGAKVQGSASQRDIDLASEDCVSAVVEDLIAKKIVPTINIKAGP